MTSPRVAPFALVRVAAVAHPAPPDAARGYRAAVRSLADLESTVHSLGRDLADALYASAGGHSAEFHRRVVLPLRRDVHNGRSPNLAGLGTLPDRIPSLRPWLAARADLTAATEAVVRHWPAALAAERAVLAELCAAEPLRRAVALSGRDLLYGLERAGVSDRRARKAEATVLRYALRASTKTSPLSWYTSVAWGHWAADDDVTWGEPVAHAQLNHTLLARLTAAVLARHRDHVPHRLAPGLQEDGGRVSFRRDTPVDGSTRAYTTTEETVGLPATAPLRFLVSTVRSAGEKGVTPTDLAGALATRLPGDQAAAAAKYVTQVLDIRLLVPVAPTDPQNPEFGWLHSLEPETADRVARIAARTAEFGRLDAKARAARLSELDAQWRELGVDPAGVTPVAEDVVLPGIARLGPAHGQAATGTLARLTPLLMAFDRQLLVRRVARTRFVAQFGPGGSARPAACTELLSDALIEALTSPNEEMDPVRAELVGMSRGEITDEMITRADELLPGWARTRPVSYSWFVQPIAGGLVVNHCYAGFARFTTRFLDQIPGAAKEVADYLAEVFPAGFAQYRPVHGFNPNLQPLLAATEIGEDARWADATPDDLVVYHDQQNDELRLRLRGEPCDVLYLGFLVPLMLPDRVAALYTDLACGWADLADLQSTVDHGDVVERGRLRYRDVVLARRSWEFGGPAADRLRTGFAAGDAGNAVAAAKLRARYGLPGHVFVSAGGTITSLRDYQARLAAPKPQYADFGNALHTRCMHKVFTRHTGDVLVTEALPVPTGRVVELIAETWWRAP